MIKSEMKKGEDRNLSLRRFGQWWQFVHRRGLLCFDRQFLDTFDHALAALQEGSAAEWERLPQAVIDRAWGKVS